MQGVGARYVVAAPVRPVGVLRVQRTLARGSVSGVSTGPGAAVADAINAMIAVHGIGFIAAFLLDNEFRFRLIGGTIQSAMAAKTFCSMPADVKGMT